MKAKDSHKASRGTVILKMLVQLPGGQKGVIHVFPGSNPRELAEAFCNKHELHDLKLHELVERHIADNMNQLKQQVPVRKPADDASNASGISREPSSRRGVPAPPPTASEVRRIQLQCKVVLMLLRNLWERRAQKAAVQGEQRASKAREAEILELHATNVRIAQLAFAQASLAEEVAASPLSITNRPSYASPQRGRTPPASVPADSPLVIELLNEPRLAVSGSLRTPLIASLIRFVIELLNEPRLAVSGSLRTPLIASLIR